MILFKTLEYNDKSEEIDTAYDWEGGEEGGPVSDSFPSVFD